MMPWSSNNLAGFGFNWPPKPYGRKHRLRRFVIVVLVSAPINLVIWSLIMIAGLSVFAVSPREFLFEVAAHCVLIVVTSLALFGLMEIGLLRHESFDGDSASDA